MSSVPSVPLVLAPLLAVALGAAPVRAEFVVEDLSEGVTAEELVDLLLGEGLTASNVSFTGAAVSAARFSGGPEGSGLSSGVVLSTGRADVILGPNDRDDAGTSNGTDGDDDLEATFPGAVTFDAAVLEFDVVADGRPLRFDYLFASEEYNEFVFAGFGDVFALAIDGVNCALVDGQPVSIDTVNGGNPFGTEPSASPDLFVNNDLQDGGPFFETQMDGLTRPLECSVRTAPGPVATSVKLVIADETDPIYDSVVVIAESSFVLGIFGSGFETGDLTDWDESVPAR